MRRVGFTLAAAAIALAVAGLLIASGRDDTVRMTAVFDRANGIVPGSQVKIAGIVAGGVDHVGLAPGPTVRIVMHVDNNNAPFHADASCSIMPEGLLSENFVSCDAGTNNAGPLRGGTVPLQHTTVPTSLQDVLDVFSAPTDDRLRLFLDNLGVGTAGRGDDLNALLRRANPALTHARDVLALLNRQRGDLATGIRETNKVLTVLDESDVRGFVTGAAHVTSTIADHRGALSEAVRRMPPLLAAARPALHSLDQAMASGTPLLRSLRAAAPSLNAVTLLAPSFVGRAQSALDAVSTISMRGNAALPAINPVASDLRTSARRAVPLTSTADRLLIDSRNRGAIEGTLSTFYGIATALGAFDSISHMIALYAKSFPQCMDDPHAAGCSARYDQPGHGTIPPDDPSCGPQGGAIWDPLTSCQSVGAAAPGRASRRPAGADRTPLAPAVTKAPVTPPKPSVKPVGAAVTDLLDHTHADMSHAEALLDFLLGP